MAHAVEVPGPVHVTRWKSPIGPLGIGVSAYGVVAVTLPDSGEPVELRAVRGMEDAELVHERRPDHTAPVVDALRRYFDGDPDAFHGLPLDPHGTEFQRAVWEACGHIPFGETRTYGDLAHAAKRPQAARAVGGAMNLNPVPLIVPCHRVVGASGGLTGYAGGLEMKEWLLEHEARHDNRSGAPVRPRSRGARGLNGHVGRH